MQLSSADTMVNKKHTWPMPSKSLQSRSEKRHLPYNSTNVITGHEQALGACDMGSEPVLGVREDLFEFISAGQL